MLGFLRLFLLQPRKLLVLLGIILMLILLFWSADFTLAPARAKATSVPFTSGQCLTYEVELKNTSEPVKQNTCFEVFADGSFAEKGAGVKITYDKEGYAKIKEIDDPLFKKVFQGQNPLDEHMIEKAKLRSEFYAEPNLQPGTVFYNNYPVKELTEYEGKPVYMVEVTPHVDTAQAQRGPLLRAVFAFLYKFDRIAYRYKQTTREAHVATVERFFYNRSTGILEAKEKWLISYDKNWQEVPGETILESKSVLLD